MFPRIQSSTADQTLPATTGTVLFVRPATINSNSTTHIKVVDRCLSFHTTDYVRLRMECDDIYNFACDNISTFIVASIPILVDPWYGV